MPHQPALLEPRNPSPPYSIYVVRSILLLRTLRTLRILRILLRLLRLLRLRSMQRWRKASSVSKRDRIPAITMVTWIFESIVTCHSTAATLSGLYEHHTTDCPSFKWIGYMQYVHRRSRSKYDTSKTGLKMILYTIYTYTDT